MGSKTLKFRKDLVHLILSGEKNITWRINDEKDIKVDDIVTLINWNTHQVFGKAKIVNVIAKKIGDISAEDFQGHEKFRNREEMLETYRKYYGKQVNNDTVVKIIEFQLIK